MLPLTWNHRCQRDSVYLLLSSEESRLLSTNLLCNSSTTERYIRQPALLLKLVSFFFPLNPYHVSLLNLVHLSTRRYPSTRYLSLQTLIIIGTLIAPHSNALPLSNKQPHIRHATSLKPRYKLRLVPGPSLKYSRWVLDLSDT